MQVTGHAVLMASRRYSVHSDKPSSGDGSHYLTYVTVGLIVSVGSSSRNIPSLLTYKCITTVFTLIGFGVITRVFLIITLPVLMILYPITVVIAFFVLVNRESSIL